ncbi:MAG: hypothetical protein ACKOX6_12615 [Bdellovibrio sp.]
MFAGRLIIAALAISTLVFGFQNCSKVAMSEVAFSDASLQAVPASEVPVSEIPDSGISENIGVIGGAGDGQTSPGGSGSGGGTVTNGDTSTGGDVTPDDKGNGNSHGKNNDNASGGDKSQTNPSSSTSGSDDDSSSNDHGELVECELNGAKDKIVLSTNVATGSNAQVSRICMSENACLNLINEYAVSHDCSLSSGAATSPSSNGVQCTKVFPGSKGTCKNAKALSDAEISGLLIKLGK